MSLGTYIIYLMPTISSFSSQMECGVPPLVTVIEASPARLGLKQPPHDLCVAIPHRREQVEGAHGHQRLPPEAEIDHLAPSSGFPREVA